MSKNRIGFGSDIVLKNGKIGIGTLNPDSKLTVIGGVSAVSFTGNLTGTATTATNLSDAGNIVTGTINSARLSGTYNIDISGSAGYVTSAGIATNIKGGSTGNIPYQSSGDNTSFITNGTTGQVLISNGNDTPYWGNVSSTLGIFNGLSIKDEGNLVGTSNSITTLDFIGSNVNVTATSGANGIATVTVSTNLGLVVAATYNMLMP